MLKDFEFLTILIFLGFFWITDRINVSRTLILAVLKQLNELSGKLDVLEGKLDDIETAQYNAAALIKKLEKRLCLSAAAVAGEQTEFTVTLLDVGASKINTIKVVREVTALGLSAALNLVESTPKTVKEGISKEEAETIKKKFADVGAVVEVKIGTFAE